MDADARRQRPSESFAICVAQIGVPRSLLGDQWPRSLVSVTARQISALRLAASGASGHSQHCVGTACVGRDLPEAERRVVGHTRRSHAAG